jgi:hypothetical protein
MKEIIIDNCPACASVNRLIQDIEDEGFCVLEKKLEDYHFRQLYFKLNVSLDKVKNIDKSGFTIHDNFLVCECHWSRIEFESPT